MYYIKMPSMKRRSQLAGVHTYEAFMIAGFTVYFPFGAPSLRKQKAQNNLHEKVAYSRYLAFQATTERYTAIRYMLTYSFLSAAPPVQVDVYPRARSGRNIAIGAFEFDRPVHGNLILSCSLELIY